MTNSITTEQLETSKQNWQQQIEQTTQRLIQLNNERIQLEDTLKGLQGALAGANYFQSLAAQPAPEPEAPSTKKSKKQAKGV